MNKAQYQTSDSLLVATLLTISGGLMDAYSFLVRGKVFANAQTGNLLLFGVHLSNTNFDVAWAYLLPVMAFGIGIGVAHFLKFKTFKLLHWRQIALLIEICCLVFVVFIKVDALANALCSLACGIQVQSFRKLHNQHFATTMCIGNLRSGIQHFVEFVVFKNSQFLKQALYYFYIIICFIVGAVIGSLLIPTLNTAMIIVSPVLLSGCFLIMFKK